MYMVRFASVVLLGALAVTAAIPSAIAQTSVPPNDVSNFKDTSMLKPPAGAKVAILEWEDLECPACAHAFPIVHEAVAHYHIPLVERDFPLKQIHIWSPQAAVYARYMNDKISPDLATEYRREVFASQYRISSREDLQRFTEQFLSQHGKQMPFVVDPTGQLQREIDADFNLGAKLGINETPTIIVVTPHHWIQVRDVANLYTAIDQAEQMAGREDGGAVRHTSAKK
jgi:protein-disulfide isomerase